MEGQTATNKQTGEKIIFRNGSWQPITGAPTSAPAPVATPGFIPGRPKEMTPQQIAAERRAEEAAARAAAAEARAGNAEARSQATFEATQSGRPLSQTDYDKAKGELSQFTTLKTAFDTFQDDYAGNIAGGVENTAQAYFDVGSPGQRDWWAQFKAADNQIRNDLFGSALTAPEKAAYEATTVSPGMDPKQVKINLAKRAEIIRQAVARRKDFYTANGFKPEAVDAIFSGVDLATPISPNAVDEQKKENRDGPALGGYPEGIDPNDIEFVERDKDGNITGYQPKDGGPFVVMFDSGNIRERDAKVQAAANAQDLREGSAGFGVKADSGLLSGLSDEFQGIGGFIGSALRLDNPIEGYQFARDVARERYDRADKATGFAGDVVELGSALAVPFGAANTVGGAARVGAMSGAVGGFGYGEGAKGSALGAGVGTAAGTILGAGAGYAGNALAARAAGNMDANVTRNALLGATEDLGMNTPARMFTEPALQNRTRAVSGTITGGSSIQNGVQQFGSEIQTAVTNKLGQNAQPLERPVAGQIAQNAFKRTDQAKKTQTDRLYEAYQKASGDPSVVPTSAIAKLDEEIAALNRSPESNAGEIAFLQKYRNDMANGKMTVETLREMRTNLRGQINEKSLGMTKAEGRIQGALDAAGDDIARTLDPSSKGYTLLQRANKSHADRMVYKKQLKNDLIGKDKDLPTDPGKAFETIVNWTNPRGDLRKLKALQNSFTPEEAADFAATIAESISKDANGNFSTTALVSNIERLEKAGTNTIETLFGPEGAKSLKNLKMVAAEHKRVAGATAGQGSAQGNDWRWTLASMFIPAAGGAAADSGTAVAAGLAGLIIKAGRDAISAKMLLSPKVTNWVRSAPKSAEPSAINAHFAKLGAIAKAQPALAADIDAFRTAVLQVANDNTSRAVAQDSQGEGGRQVTQPQ